MWSSCRLAGADQNLDSLLIAADQNLDSLLIRCRSTCTRAAHRAVLSMQAQCWLRAAAAAAAWPFARVQAPAVSPILTPAGSLSRQHMQNLPYLCSCSRQIVLTSIRTYRQVPMLGPMVIVRNCTAPCLIPFLHVNSIVCCLLIPVIAPVQRNACTQMPTRVANICETAFDKLVTSSVLLLPCSEAPLACTCLGRRRRYPRMQGSCNYSWSSRETRSLGTIRSELDKLLMAFV